MGFFIMLILFAIIISLLITHRNKNNIINNFKEIKKLDNIVIFKEITNEEIIKNLDFYNLQINKIFTKTEMYFFKQLKNYIKEKNNNLNIFTKVRIADIVKDSRYNYKEKIITFNKINRKHIDFVISDDYGNIKGLIELDGYSHNYKKTRKSDELKNELFKILKIPFYRFKVQYGKYNFNKLNNIL